MTKIDYDTAVKDVQEIIKGREDYVYIDPYGTRAGTRKPMTCAYFDPSTKQPSCLVGHLFARYGVTYEDISDHNNHAIFEAQHDTDVFFNSRALNFLESVQEYQDSGVSWGDAYAKSLEKETGGTNGHFS